MKNEDKNVYGVIYKIKNKINGKFYIGQTVQDPIKRWKKHVKLNWDKSNKMPICLAIKKYGEENFEFEVIKNCNNLEELNDYEKYYAKLYNSFSPNGYNLKAGNGKGSMSDELKKKIGDANRGKVASDETKRKLSESHKGYKVSDETKEKLRQHNKGKRPCKLAQENLVKSLAKKYAFINPDGDIIKIYNLKQFCKKNNLSDSKMVLVNQRKRNHHKGWKRYND